MVGLTCAINAGSTFCGAQVHPRACGELDQDSDFRRAQDGSSPRVRGTPTDGLDELADARFIPARAGNSNGAVTRSQARAVHPRACGELGRVCGSPRNEDGSSPRVRGTQAFGVTSDGGLRFIPARAGNSRRFTCAKIRTAVHPRACGELAPITPLSTHDGGSSPRVRGTSDQT